MSRHDLKELGEHLDTGQAGLVVVAVSDMGAKVEDAMKRAAKLEQKEIQADTAELERDALRGLKNLPEPSSSHQRQAPRLGDLPTVRERPPRHPALIVPARRERTSMADTAVAHEPPEARALNKGLKKNAIGYASSVVIGVASTAPGYSLAAVLGLIVAIPGVGVHAPAVLMLSFVPMLLVALAYKYLNQADPDAGTTFSWATRAFGPRTGWLGGWAIIVADIIVMANLAEIAGRYSFLLFGFHNPSTLAVTAIGVAWIAIMTVVCVIGIEVNAKTQRWLLTAEVVTLAIFAAVALVRVFTGHAGPGAITPDLSWFSPFAIPSVGALTAGLLVAVFIYWGWDSLVTVNEETEDSETTPGKAAVMSTLILVGIYLIVSTAAIAFGGVGHLAGDESGDVLGLLAGEVFGSAMLGKIVIIAVLTSA